MTDNRKFLKLKQPKPIDRLRISQICQDNGIDSKSLFRAFRYPATVVVLADNSRKMAANDKGILVYSMSANDEAIIFQAELENFTNHVNEHYVMFQDDLCDYTKHLVKQHNEGLVNIYYTSTMHQIKTRASIRIEEIGAFNKEIAGNKLYTDLPYNLRLNFSNLLSKWAGFYESLMLACPKKK